MRRIPQEKIDLAKEISDLVNAHCGDDIISRMGATVYLRRMLDDGELVRAFLVEDVRAGISCSEGNSDWLMHRFETSALKEIDGLWAGKLCFILNKIQGDHDQPTAPEFMALLDLVKSLLFTDGLITYTGQDEFILTGDEQLPSVVESGVYAWCPFMNFRLLRDRQLTKKSVA